MKQFIEDHQIGLLVSVLSTVIAYVLAINYRGFTLIGGETMWLGANYIFWKIKWIDENERKIKWEL